MMRACPTVLDGVTTLVRFGLAAVWLVSGVLKISDAGQTYVAVQAYEVLPTSLVSPVATALPLVEIVLGLLLVAGLLTRLAGAASVVLVLVLIAAIGQAWARGLAIDCGCFGGGGRVAEGQPTYLLEILRDLGFLVLASWLTIRPRSFVSLDGWLGAAGEARTSEP